MYYAIIERRMYLVKTKKITNFIFQQAYKLFLLFEILGTTSTKYPLTQTAAILYFVMAQIQVPITGHFYVT